MQSSIPLVGYLRVSDMGDREVDDPSFQSTRQQRRSISAITALTPGAEVVEWIEDLDRSGGTMDRPGVRKAIEMVESGQVKGIAVAYLDRWARTLEALEMIERWADEGKLFISAAERFDPTTSHGKFALGLMLLVAKYYRDLISERWRDACRDAIERGVHTTVPYGYRRQNGKGSKLEIVESEAKVVRRIFAERIHGVGLGAIAEGLNADELPSPKGGRWTRQAILAMTRVRAYQGEAHRGGYATAGAHAAIIPAEAWNQAQKPRGAARQNNKSLLVGLARCDGCGYVLGAGSNRQQRRYNCVRHHAELRCPSPTTASAEGLEALVSDLFLERYGKVTVRGANASDPLVAEAAAALERARGEYKTWRDDVDLRTALGDAEYTEGLLARKAAVDGREEAHASAVRLSGATTLAIDGEGWDELSLAGKRELMRAGIDAVVLRRARSTHEPLSDRVEVLWTGELDHDGTRRGIAAAVRGRHP